MTVVTGQKAVKTSAWLLYTLIVLEILFMVSPLAAYYYSIFATPLNALQDSPHTAWLTMYLLPHFTYSDSWLANGLVLISWPLILLGLFIFVIGFCQIYWSKFTGKGAVDSGLYRSIRHPQYLAFAIIGLGATLYWSRFIIVIAFVSMLCVYVLLAQFEERICLEKFGDSYRDYMNRTGRFLPRKLEMRLSRVSVRLPESGWPRGALLIGGFAVVLAVTITAGQWLRNHVIDSLIIADGPERVTVFVAPVSQPTADLVVELLNREELPGSIAYVAPSSWRIPELGFNGSEGQTQHSGVSELLHPTTHGNSLSFDEGRLTVLLASAATVRADAKGLDRLKQALNIKPVEFVELDVTAGAVIDRRPAGDGDWAGIPVPTF